MESGSDSVSALESKVWIAKFGFQNVKAKKLNLLNLHRYTLVYGLMPFEDSNYRQLIRLISEGRYCEPRVKSGKLVGKPDK